MRFGGSGLAVLLLCGLARAEVKTTTVKYKAGDVEAQSFVAWDDAVTGKRPGVVIVPEWWGLTDYPKTRARQLAQLGYVAIAADVYGNGQTTDDPKEAGKLAGALKAGDRKELRIPVVAALQQLKANPNADPNKTPPIGY